MYSSLDRVDIQLKPDSDGRPRFIQTDHRSPEEIENDRELSVLFALARVLGPRRMADPDGPEPLVVYMTQTLPPEFLQQAILAAGGEIKVGQDLDLPSARGITPELDEVVESAFANLAGVVAADYGVPLNVEGLAAIEADIAESARNPDDDEVAYWTAVMRLGSFAGEVIRAVNGGTWSLSQTGSLPFVLVTTFKGEEAKVNPLGKAIKRFANGEEDSLAGLAKLLIHNP